MTTFPRLPRESERRSWMKFGLWSVTIYVTVPLARTIRSVVTERLGRVTFTAFVVVCVVGAFVVAIRHLRREGGGWSRSRIGWLVAVAVAYLAWTIYIAFGAPEEAVHFLEYGVLGLLAFRALTHRVRDGGIYLLATLACALVGTGDEIIQWLTPGRVFAFDDMILNAAGSGLLQVALAKSFQPDYIAGRPGPRTRRLLARLGSAQLILLGICASNTPDRIAWYAPRIPFLRYLMKSEGVMSEYGHPYRDPETGTWYSRFTLEQLARQDAARHAEAARVLDEYRDEKRYPDFLKRYTPLTDPFLHEIRVHLFRRDRFIARIADFPNDVAQQRFHATVAFRENRVLEKHFPLTLSDYSGRLTPEQRARLEAMIDPDLDYVTRVGEDLITRFTEGGIWVGVIGGVALLTLLGRRRAPRPVAAVASGAGDGAGPAGGK